MLDKVKITITREDGSPICKLVPETTPDFLADDTHFFVARKKGEMVQTWTVAVPGLLELALAALDELDASVRKELCDSCGLEYSEGNS